MYSWIRESEGVLQPVHDINIRRLAAQDILKLSQKLLKQSSRRPSVKQVELFAPKDILEDFIDSLSNLKRLDRPT
jgi:hypothetical protein